MSINSNRRSNSSTACYLRSTCKTESDREHFDKLFAHDWEYFVIKRDESSNQLSTFVECCGSDLKVG